MVDFLGRWYVIWDLGILLVVVFVALQILAIGLGWLR